MSHGRVLPPGQRPPLHPSVLSPVFWRDGAVVLLDQRRLPHEEIWRAYSEPHDVIRAIREMEVRGAPAIGCAAAFAIALEAAKGTSASSLRQLLRATGEARPTAVNLGVALHRMANAFTAGRDLVEEASRIWEEDLAHCRAIGAHGAELLPDGATVLTHCNAGALATAGYGTALGVIRAAVESGKRIRVLADETRPWLQGARLTAWELAQDGIPVELIVDGAAASFLAAGEIQAVVVGADRVALNGDVANKIGTLGVAVAAHTFGVPFYVALPPTTFDKQLADGREIPIEKRDENEVLSWDLGGDRRRLAAGGVSARNPVFDVTPARFVSGLVTVGGVLRPPYRISP
jgi:methylthioribose-1-phosphate isomerase